MGGVPKPCYFKIVAPVLINYIDEKLHGLHEFFQFLKLYKQNTGFISKTFFFYTGLLVEGDTKGQNSFITTTNLYLSLIASTKKFQ